MKFWAQSLIEALKSKNRPSPMPYLQLLEAPGQTGLVSGLQEPLPCKTYCPSSKEQRWAFNHISVLLPLLALGSSWGHSRVPNSYHRFVRLLLQLANCWRSWVISLGFFISYHVAICSPSSFSRLHTTASFFFFLFCHSDHPLHCNPIYKG